MWVASLERESLHFKCKQANCLLKQKCQPSSEECNKIQVWSFYNTAFTMPGKQSKIVETRKCEVY